MTPFPLLAQATPAPPEGSPAESASGASGGDAAVADGAEAAGQLLRDLQDISIPTILAIVAGTWLAIFAARKVLPYLAKRGPSQLRLYLLGAVPILRLLLLTLAILWIVPLVFNITFENFLVIAGAASVAIGFAFKDYASSLIAGIVAVFEKPYRPGDWVRIDGTYGEVVRVGLRALQLRTLADDVVTVPHALIWDGNVANANDGARTLQCCADFYVAPDHDAARLRSALQDVALTSAYLGYAHPVFVVIAEEPFGTHYKLKAYPFDMRDQVRFVSDLTTRGKEAVRACGAVQVHAPVNVGGERQWPGN